MTGSRSFEVPVARGTHRFHTTRWSLLLEAGAGDAPAMRALDELCGLYWPPLYAFARRRGYDAEAALDLTQGFFVELLERDSLALADPERGRFRTFMLTCFTRFLSNEAERTRAQKRGGDRRHVSLDAEDAEGAFGPAAVDPKTPEAEFERRWALTLLDSVLERLRGEFAKRGREALFAERSPLLQAGTSVTSHRELAQGLGLSEGAVKVTVHRMRQRFRELLLEEVGQTVQSPEDAVDEVGHLLSALGGGSEIPRPGL